MQLGAGKKAFYAMRPSAYKPRLAGPKKMSFKMMNWRKADVNENTKNSLDRLVKFEVRK